MSILAYTDHKSGDYDHSKRKRFWSWVCTVTAFIIGFILTAAIISVVAAFTEDVESAWNDFKDWIKDRLCDIGFKNEC